MKFSFFSMGGLALVLLLTPVSSARGDLIPWMYNWSRSPTEILADAPGTGRITLTDESLKSAVGDSDIVATNLRTFSTATAANPDTFTAKAYSLNLYLYDVESGASTTLSFTGQIDGRLTAQSSLLRNTFTGATTQQVVLGANRYVATIGPYTPPGPPNSSNSGSISAHATITVEAIVQVPEPATLGLSGLGVLMLAVARWRVRRRVASLERGAA